MVHITAIEPSGRCLHMQVLQPSEEGNVEPTGYCSSPTSHMPTKAMLLSNVPPSWRPQAGRTKSSKSAMREKVRVMLP